VNEPLSFINFVAAYNVGTTVEGEVVSFTSHGAMVDVSMPGGGVLHCYIPLTAMGSPPPTKARQVLKKGEVRPFVLAGLDPPRRVAELAIAPSDRPRKKRGDAEQARSAPAKKAGKKAAQKAKKAPASSQAAPKKAGAPTKKAAKKIAPPKKGAPATPAKKAAKATKAKKAGKAAPAKKAAKTPPKQAAKAKKAPAKKAPRARA
jgi:hypothetical protein